MLYKHPAFLLVTGCLFCAVSHAQSPVTLPAAYPPGTKVNYVRTWDAIKPGLDTTTIQNPSVTIARQTTVYVDGLG